MSNIAIKVENPGKKYFIKHEQKESYQTFQDVLLNGNKNIISSLNPFQNKNNKSIEEHCALKDINFDINQCDNKVGIIRRNGTGKQLL